MPHPVQPASPLGLPIKGRWLRAHWSLWLALVGVVGADAVMGLSGLPSLISNAALTLLMLPWAVVVFQMERSDANEPKAQWLALLLRVGLAAVALGFLVAKWAVVLSATTGEAGFTSSSRNYGFGLLLVASLGLSSRGLHVWRLLQITSERPTRLMATSFGVAGVVGAFLLSLPISLRSLAHVSLIDNLFMSFSAVCVTGLAVRNVAETYTLFGQGVLCALIQIGGLGIMVLSAAIVILAGQRFRVRSSAALTELVDGASLATLKRTVLMICVYTFSIEALGALLLYPQFLAHPDIQQGLGPLAGAGSPAWAAVFHSVSAFCNAGFSNLQGGMMPLAGSSGVISVIAILIVLGGIGFPVLDELARRAVKRVRGKSVGVMSLSSRLAIRTSLVLIAAMTVAYFALEWRTSSAGLSPLDRLKAALFQSVSSRSAGFNVVDVGAMLPATLVLTCAAMFIGASPGSTGGGIKTTTLAVLFSNLRAELFNRPPHLLGRQLPEAVIRKAIGVTVLSLVTVLFAFFFMLLFERHPPLAVAFEVVSAFSTTGLSTGITPELSTPGRLLITLVMFIGRIGPMTVALALAKAHKPSLVAFPQERVMIG